MKRGKSIIGILSVCVFALISFIAIEKKGEVKANLNVTVNDSIKIDSLQFFINQYCQLNSSIDSITKIIEFEKLGDSSKILRIEELDKSREVKIYSLKSVINNLKTATLKLTGSKEVYFNTIKYHLFVADLDSTKIRLHLLRPKHKSSLGNVKDYLEAKKIEPLMITNAGMFTPTFEPEGLYIEENPEKKYSLDVGDQKSHLNFYLRPNGVFYIDNKNIPHIDTTQEFARLQKSRKFKVKLATQSGPMLVINGRIHPAFVKGSKNYKIRSGVGIINPKKVVFACTLHGSNFYDFAVFMKDIFNCKNALFLDGAISKMYLHDIDSTETGGQFGPILSVSRKNKK